MLDYFSSPTLKSDGLVGECLTRLHAAAGGLECTMGRSHHIAASASTIQMHREPWGWPQEVQLLTRSVHRGDTSNAGVDAQRLVQLSGSVFEVVADVDFLLHVALCTATRSLNVF